MNGKKGMEAGFLVAIMITIVAFVLIAGVIYRFYAKAEDTEAETICHDSIALRAAMALRMTASTSTNPLTGNRLEVINNNLRAIPVLCKTIDKKVKGDKKVVMKQMAEKMARCWWMFGEGRYDHTFYSSSANVQSTVFNFENLGQYKCFNCYSILVEDIEDDSDITQQEFIEFLNREKYSKSNKTYVDYIQSVGGPGRVLFAFNKGSGNIEPNKAYSILILPKLKSINNPVGMVVGGVFKWVGGSAITVLSGGILGVVGGGALAVSGASEVAAVLFANDARDLSSIYFTNLELGQQMCGSGDIAGQ